VYNREDQQKDGKSDGEGKRDEDRRQRKEPASLSDWMDLFARFYPEGSIPSDWAWPKRVLSELLPCLDGEDKALFAILADLSDRLTRAVSPFKNPAINYGAYFNKPGSDRVFADYETLATSITKASKTYRIGLPVVKKKTFQKKTKTTCKRKQKPQHGIDKLEWWGLNDARNHTTLAGTSASCVLAHHNNESSWKRMVEAAALWSKAVNSTSEAEEKSYYEKAKNLFPIDSTYRPAHVYRLFCFLVGFESPLLSSIFQVDQQMLSFFKIRLNPFLAAVAACQCQDVTRNETNYDILKIVVNDRPRFLREAADLTTEEEKEIETCFHFGPNRIVTQKELVLAARNMRAFDLKRVAL
jgi:hypothetical protein